MAHIRTLREWAAFWENFKAAGFDNLLDEISFCLESAAERIEKVIQNAVPEQIPAKVNASGSPRYVIRPASGDTPQNREEIRFG